MKEITQMGMRNRMSGDLISIIVPIYNVEKYLERCLDSIALQSYTNFQVLLVNDGSKDRSRDIAETFTMKDCRFRLYESEPQGYLLPQHGL